MANLDLEKMPLKKIIENLDANKFFTVELEDVSEDMRREIQREVVAQAIHDELQVRTWQITAFDRDGSCEYLETYFDDIVDEVNEALGEHRDLFTQAEIRRMVGTEIGWYAMRHAKGRDTVQYRRGRTDQQWREDFIQSHVYGRTFDELHDIASGAKPDPARLRTRGRELKSYIKTWADFPAFGFGIENLDRATGGILPGEICVLTGAPGTMKTSLALSAVDDFVTRKAQGKILFISADMPPREIELRMLERESGVPNFQLRQMFADDSPQAAKIEDFVNEKYEDKLEVLGNDDGIELNLQNVLIECKARQPQLVIIDYLTRLKSSGQSDLEFVEKAMKAILAHAHRYETSFLLLSQMSRASRSEQATGRMGGHSRGGGIVEELSDCEIELVQQASEFEGEKPLVIACVTKARRGIAGQYFSLDYDGPIKRFTGYAQRAERQIQKKAIFRVAQERSFY